MFYVVLDACSIVQMDSEAMNVSSPRELAQCYADSFSTRDWDIVAVELADLRDTDEISEDELSIFSYDSRPEMDYDSDDEFWLSGKKVLDFVLCEVAKNEL